MDKFAVDLGKVLDDFEYNEGREESVVPTLFNNLSSHNLQQTRNRLPATTYRRPTFEPINLSDADFAAASIPTADNFVKNKEEYISVNSYTSHLYNASVGVGEYSSGSIISLPQQPEKGEKKENGRSNSISIYEGKSVEIHQAVNDDDICGSKSADGGTPDLLDSNTLKPNQKNISNSEQDPASFISQLPDITSVSSGGGGGGKPATVETGPPPSLPPPPSPPFDLIKPVSFEEKLPPIVDVGQLLKEELPEIQVKPITFTPLNEDDDDLVDQADLVEYLQSLEADIPTIDLSVEKRGGESTILTTQSAVEQVSFEKGGVDSEENLQEISRPEVELEVKASEGVFDEHLEEQQQEQGTLPTDDIQGSGETEIEAAQSVAHVKIISTQITEDKTIPASVSGQEHEQVNAVKISEDEVVEPLETSVQEVGGQACCDEACETSNGTEVTQPVAEEETKPSRPSSLALQYSSVADCEETPTPTNNSDNVLNSSTVESPMDKLGKFPPYWVPDTESDYCMQCRTKFTVIKRRHHCRACGLVLCSKCCNLKAPLEYLDFAEARVCQPCFNIMYRLSLEDGRYLGRQPNPNNPMEYCSTIPPLQQAASTINQPPPSVLVPTGVLKREGRSKSDVPKQVVFSDGIRPGGDLTELDGPSESRIIPRRGIRRLATPPGGKSPLESIFKRPLNPTTQSFIPDDCSGLPPLVVIENGHLVFSDQLPAVINEDEPIKFAINYNLFVNVKKAKLECCVNRICWSACSEGLACVGQDEVAIILECLPDESTPPQDLFNLINTLHQEASKGTTVSEMCFTPNQTNLLFGSKDHGGFLFIRPTFQCTTKLLLPAQPYLIAILIHRWETPWAKLFPLRLILRLGAEYRYYPCPLVSIRNRQALYTDIGHTVMKVLMDFKKYSYSLASVRGLLIHMEDRQTTILFPKNRYDQVVRALNNSNESVLAFGANLSLRADSHLVCIQGTKDENTYHTQAINIHNKPRRVTGASFVVFNGALKGAGLSGKSSIIEDGLMVHLPSDSMTALRTALREMKDYTISCGPNDEETVYLQWTDDDTNFNVGVKSCIDGTSLEGVPSIRVHNGIDYPANHKLIRWTEVFILQSEEGRKASEPLDVSRVTESLARATCMALVADLDSLSASNLNVIAIRATIHPECVGYEAGSCGSKLPAIYMKHLDEGLIPVIHEAVVAAQDTPAVLELIFRIMNHHPS